MIIAVIFGLFFVVGMVGFTAIILNPDFLNMFLEEKTLDESHFKLTYKSPWTSTSVKATEGPDKKALSYDDGKGYLVVNDTTTVSEITSYGLSSEIGRKYLYELFYNSYSDGYKNNINAQKFQILKDDIYYAKFDAIINGNKRGSMFIVASDSKDLCISFMTNTTKMDMDELDEKALEIIKTIELK